MFWMVTFLRAKIDAPIETSLQPLRRMHVDICASFGNADPVGPCGFDYEIIKSNDGKLDGLTIEEQARIMRMCLDG